MCVLEVSQSEQDHLSKQFVSSLVSKWQEKCTLKFKYEDKQRTCLAECESLYFLVECDGKPLCLILSGIIGTFQSF